MTPLAIYDMDRTVTRTGTYAKWLLFWARREAPWRLLLVPLAVVNGLLFKAGIIDRKRVKELNQRVMMGRTVAGARLSAAVEAYADTVMAANCLAKARVRIAADQSEGRRVVLATASHRYYVEAIARRLGVADVIGTESVWDGDALTWRVAGDNCYGAAKRRMVEAWLADHDLTGAPIRFYSDHVTDAPMFELAGEPVVVNAHGPLLKLAAERGWPVEDWR